VVSYPERSPLSGKRGNRIAGPWNERSHLANASAADPARTSEPSVDDRCWSDDWSFPRYSAGGRGASDGCRPWTEGRLKEAKTL
jgi:hypothetical protein